MVLKSKKIEAVRPDVPTVQLEKNVEIPDKRVNILVTETMRLDWKRHVMDFRYKSVAQFIIEAVQEKIARDRNNGK